MLIYSNYTPHHHHGVVWSRQRLGQRAHHCRRACNSHDNPSNSFTSCLLQASPSIDPEQLPSSHCLRSHMDIFALPTDCVHCTPLDHLVSLSEVQGLKTTPAACFRVDFSCESKKNNGCNAAPDKCLSGECDHDQRVGYQISSVRKDYNTFYVGFEQAQLEGDFMGYRNYQFLSHLEQTRHSI